MVTICRYGTSQAANIIELSREDIMKVAALKSVINSATDLAEVCSLSVIDGLTVPLTVS